MLWGIEKLLNTSKNYSNYERHRFLQRPEDPIVLQGRQDPPRGRDGRHEWLTIQAGTLSLLDRSSISST